ncbi:kinase-like domain-containing protein [Infundibulicybe gibba]|nr:kinase-like domain-containing protein [Infundibulicybe gibba]
MPPPVIIPPTHDFRPIYTPSEVPPPTPPSSGPRVEVSKSIARAATRVAGFKPIGTSSSLKKFFPGDDDDVDPVAANQGGRRQSPAAPVPPRYDAVNPQDRSITTNPPVANGDEPRWGSPDGYRNRDSHPPQNLNARVTPPHIQSQQPPLPTLADLRLQVQADEVEAKPRHDETVTANTEALSLVPKELYAIVSQVGEGTFGKVYKAQNTVTKVHLALKRIRMESEKDGFPVTAMREIKLLQSLRHENVVRLYEMMVSNGSVYMVFEYMDHDLTGVLSQTQFNFTDAHLKSLCHQMLAGLAYLHHKGVIHRDIKGSNILINNRGELKLADFGLARFYQKRRRMDYTNRVITLWYRPPELLFGATVYGPEVDMWSAGCIMLELFTKKPVFQGNDEIHQLDVVYKILGTPNPDRWASIMHLPWYELIKPRESIPNRFRELFQKWMSPAALDLAEELLAYNPAERITALQAMNTPYFTVEEPDAARPVGLATLEGEWHELETKRERAKKRRKIDTVIP